MQGLNYNKKIWDEIVFSIDYEDIKTSKEGLTC
jgi:hypothetical protein